ncbi:MAG: iron ABC transporter permease [Bdellovibrionales bacterium]|nr:iron ABC transporter permease [Bdellovibrionales bacterium]
MKKAVVIAALLWALGFWFSLSFGVLDSPTPEIIAGLRLPRALLASAVGIGLSIAGVILQSLFSNPLAEPYTLGISSGASVGAVLSSVLHLSLWFGKSASTSLFAIVGAVAFGLILVLSERSRSRGTGSGSTHLLLTGMMLTFLGSSWIALMIAVSDSDGIQSALFWLLGDLSRAEFQPSLLALVSAAAFAFLAYRKAEVLDLFLLGEEAASSLGLSVQKQRRGLLILASCLVALSVSSAGMVGFVGLMIPHFCRRITGALHRPLIPLSAIVGAAVMVWADLGSRLIFQPIEIPVGVITALVGSPLFIFLIQKRSGVTS